MSRLSQLASAVTVALTDLFHSVSDPSGANLDKWITASNLRHFITNTYNVMDYGATGDGTTDDYAAILAAHIAASLTGGTVYFPAPSVAYRINSQFVLPNNSASPVPAQRPVKWKGDGCLFNGRGGAIYGGTIIDLRYSGAGSKIETYGLGLWDIEGITFTDYGTSSTPFFFVSNTTIMPHDCAFVGNPTKANATCDQDVFILGGTAAGVYDGTNNGSFQGYGTVIERCYFGRIRRGMYLRCSANAIVIQNNTWWSTCGAPSTSYAAIEFAPTSPQTCAGNVVSNNLFEMVGYYYGIKASRASINSFIANNFYDPTTVTAYYRFESDAQFNLIIAGYSDDAKPLISDNGTNMVIVSHQSQSSIFPQPVTFSNAVGASFTGPINASASPAAINAQPTVSVAETWIPFFARRSTAESSNPGTLIFQLQQKGIMTIGGTQAGQIDILGQDGVQVAGFSGTLKNWFASGAGGAMSQDSGSGGSYFTMKNFGVKFQDHNGGPLRVLIGAGLDGIKFGASSDANIYRSAANVLKTDSLLVGALGVVTNTGTTGSRPGSPLAGQMYYDTTISKPIWWNGSNWKDATGATV